ncbi:5602_t:CDS:2 [Ambispora gerdemannii]|uniref:5602_t:CDS:1 n=1 Tax=Ambispora gerdemannii TaxID=144530 RepID=A0A9N8VEF5_9GLOM|nr:5602_t:CDS:2 [Ambispora gerdemannii]
MSLVEVTSGDHFNKLINDNDKVVVDFSADWCAPCNGIAPFYKELAEKYPGLTFLKVNVENLSDVSEGVSALPTFKFYFKGKSLQNDVVGANRLQLEALVKNLEALTA